MWRGPMTKLVVWLALSSLVACGGGGLVTGPGDGPTSGDDAVNDDAGATGGDATTERAGMILVPAGPFWRGCNSEIGDDCESDPQAFLALNVPYRELEISEFWIDEYEVTVEDYATCVEAGACTVPEGIPWGDMEPPDVPRLPITGIDWEQAVGYCAWRGKRLPTEAEWEKAARGDDGRRFPWGNDWPVCGQAHLLFGDECERIRHVLPVDAHPGDVSPYGVRGMIGNVQEWVQDWRGLDYYATCPTKDPPGPAEATGPPTNPDPDYKIVRGGYWDAGVASEGNSVVSVSLRRWGTRDDGVAGRIGFRCARSEAPPPE